MIIQAWKTAQNEGAGNFSSVSLRLGLMVGDGGTVRTSTGGMFTDAFSVMQGQPSKALDQFCEECSAKLIPDFSFCDECGHPVSKQNSCIRCGCVFESPGTFYPKCGTKRER